ncbi:hypothetical protein HOLDEFILI_00552 [Holdemania filiformis DSM 12042]|uniref:Uncharacterized protein n=1 Tax=Holdemania filiformis DSM 12042 TaxID=545696 RepID=B9Y421_9FIRM|nr:hypothetical protein HOLDEFILI_00552 [Holdemania filiformis DSM 12042]
MDQAVKITKDSLLFTVRIKQPGKKSEFLAESREEVLTKKLGRL